MYVKLKAVAPLVAEMEKCMQVQTTFAFMQNSTPFLLKNVFCGNLTLLRGQFAIFGIWKKNVGEILASYTNIDDSYCDLCAYVGGK